MPAELFGLDPLTDGHPVLMHSLLRQLNMLDLAAPDRTLLRLAFRVL